MAVIVIVNFFSLKGQNTLQLFVLLPNIRKHCLQLNGSHIGIGLAYSCTSCGGGSLLGFVELLLHFSGRSLESRDMKAELWKNFGPGLQSDSEFIIASYSYSLFQSLGELLAALFKYSILLIHEAPEVF